MSQKIGNSKNKPTKWFKKCKEEKEKQNNIQSILGKMAVFFLTCQWFFILSRILMNLNDWTLLSHTHFVYNYLANPRGTALQIHTGFNHSLSSPLLTLWVRQHFFLSGITTLIHLCFLSIASVTHSKDETDHITAVFNNLQWLFTTRSKLNSY